MLSEPNCFKRKCKNYLGIIWLGNTERTEVNYCKAFPKGIPDEIAYGDNLHLKPLRNQKNNIIFEEEN